MSSWKTICSILAIICCWGFSGLFICFVNVYSDMNSVVNLYCIILGKCCAYTLNAIYSNEVVIKCNIREMSSLVVFLIPTSSAVGYVFLDIFFKNGGSMLIALATFNLSPLIAIVIGGYWLGEKFTWRIIMGNIGMVISCFVLTSMTELQKGEIKATGIHLLYASIVLAAWVKDNLSLSLFGKHQINHSIGLLSFRKCCFKSCSRVPKEYQETSIYVIFSKSSFSSFQSSIHV